MYQTIEIIGLGAGDLDQLPLGIYRKLTRLEQTVFVRTKEHPVVKELQKEGVEFVSFDNLYETSSQFGDVYEAIVNELVEAARINPVIYAVPGHPMLAEQTVKHLLEQDKVPVEITGGQSYLDALFTALQIDPIDGFQFADGTAFDRSKLHYRQHIIIGQVYDRMTASNVKLELLEDLPPDYSVSIVEAAGSQQQNVTQVQLDQLDRMFESVHNLVSVYVPPAPDDLLLHTFRRLHEVIAALRAPDGCPWDRAQTHETLRQYAIEEVYELVEAIDEQDDDGIVEELGDLLLQVMLHSQIGADDGYFTIDDVIHSITRKMIHRHPHIFADQSAETVDDVYRTWDALKQEEKGEERTSVLDGVPAGLPGLAKAFKLQHKAAKVRFGWDNAEDVFAKFQEEWKEFQGAIANQPSEAVEAELGDVLFVLANLARYYKVNPEIALNRTNEKFVRRFTYIEKQLKDLGKDIQTTSLEEMDYYWKEAKRSE
ncbi:bifunctional methyltransferase/pyrophosphohydrolase YabN [Lentibacillus cibarius]|uniref:Nucleoside triphosphate pyrophosphohydrolase n=1 Tax=Lentibacillus cibarius TaxID=2583219 RepID=A0A5S3R7R3_9BACI|nr:nucleoside triphosphate pyrophosphohydrolase [Lentibacillus cibarius]TMN22333.1 nucleoside triphosphate pyrophosphohydrolase [Lentibacillus cibarius]